MSNPGNPVGAGNLETSGTSDYDPPTGDIITRAYRILGVINEDETPTKGMVADAMDTLNAMIKELMATGIHLWTVEEGILFVQQFQARYLLFQGQQQLGANGPAFACDAFSWGLSSLGQNAPQGATSITLSGQYGYYPTIVPTQGMNIGISLDTGQAFWTTISGAVTGPPNALVIPLQTALPSSSSAQEFTYWFSPCNALLRPLRVPFARRIDFNVGVSGSSIGPIMTPLTNMMSRHEYFDLPNTQSPGQITQAYYNPARDKGEMYVWNVPENVDSGLRFTYYRPLQDFDSIDDLADLPQEWDNALKWNLAVELGPQYDIATERWDRIAARAAAKLELAMGWDREPQSIYFGRGYDQVRR